MSDGTDAPPGAGATAPTEFTPSDLGNLIAEARQKPDEPAADGAEPATAANESPAEGDAGPEKVPGETKVADPEDNLPSIEPPRSWTKEEKDAFKAYPRDAQALISAQVARHEAEFLRRSNEAAEKLKGLTAKEQQAEQARQSYEARQAAYTKALETALQANFGDIQTIADVRKLQAEDPFRFQAWQVHQMELTAAQAEKQQVDQDKAKAKQAEDRDRKSREHALLIKEAPEFADAEKLNAAQKSAAKLFRDSGFTDDQLATIVDDNPVLDDHRMQLIINDANRYRELMKAKPVAAKVPVPPVQHPGASKPHGSAQSDTITKLSAQLERSGETRDLGNLIGALRRA